MRRARSDRRQRGVTLIELMFTLGIATIVIAIITRVVFVQQKTFMDQIGYAETQQNARASISLLKLYVRKAGWGMAAAADAAGEVPLGACFEDEPNTHLQKLDCDRADADIEGKTAWPNGTDRLRVVAINANSGAHVTTPQDSPVGSLSVGIRVDPESGDTVPATTYTDIGQPLDPGDLALVSGQCIGAGNGKGADLVTLQNNGGIGTGTVYYDYSYLNLLGTGTALTCTSGYASDFSFGRADVADFWIDRTTDPNHPSLRMRTDPRQPLDSGFVVAYDIDDLQVQYLLDTACEPLTSPHCAPGIDTPDFVWDEVCDDLNPIAATAEGGCDGAGNAAALGMTLRQRLARVVGVRVAIVARTRKYNKALDDFDDSSATVPDGEVGAKITVQNHTTVGKRDGYRRWIYRATIALRNNEL